MLPEPDRPGPANPLKCVGLILLKYLLLVLSLNLSGPACQRFRFSRDILIDLANAMLPWFCFVLLTFKTNNLILISNFYSEGLFLLLFRTL